MSDLFAPRGRLDDPQIVPKSCVEPKCGPATGSVPTTALLLSTDCRNRLLFVNDPT